MNGQLHFDGKEDHDDPGLRVVEQHLARFEGGTEVVVTVYGDGSMTAARPKLGSNRFEVVALRPWGTA